MKKMRFMLGPAAKRDAVAHLQVSMALSERRACQIFAVDRTTVRYVSKRPTDKPLRERLRDLANERRRFGYRRLFALLRQEGETCGKNRICRLYREEGLRTGSSGATSRRASRCRTASARAATGECVTSC
jgi:putative transposase